MLLFRIIVAWNKIILSVVIAAVNVDMRINGSKKLIEN